MSKTDDIMSLPAWERSRMAAWLRRRADMLESDFHVREYGPMPAEVQRLRDRAEQLMPQGPRPRARQITAQSTAPGPGEPLGRFDASNAGAVNLGGRY